MVARLVVATSLGLAGVTKLVDRQGAIDGAAALGVRDRWAPVVGTALAPTELALGVLLFVGPLERAAAVAALLLFVAFTVLLSANLARGSRPTCHCFGEISDAPIGPFSVVRNVVLVACCAGLAVAGRPDYAAVSALGCVVVIGAAFAWRRRPRDTGATGLPVGTKAPVSGAAGNVQTLLLFTDTRCKPCHRLLPEVANWHGGELSVAVVMRGDVDPSDAEEWELPVLLSDDGGIATSYRVNATPSAVLIDADGRIASHVVAGAIAIRALVGGVAGDGSVRALTPGADAPPLRLPAAAADHVVDLASFAGGLTAVVFVRASDDYPVARPADAARTLLVAVGEPVHSPGLDVGVDADGMTARAFGVTETPAAVLVDAAGRVDSTAVGADEVRALLARADTLVRLASKLGSGQSPVGRPHA